MDRISHLPDELLLKILSILPTTKDVVATMVLSKRWQFLWMMIPRLVYDDSYQNPMYECFCLFVDRSLFKHHAPVIETLHFKLGHICGSGDIQEWMGATDKRCVREMIIQIVTYSGYKAPVFLPWSLYSGVCRMLVTLKLINAVILDDFTAPISFPSLKTLTLKSIKYPSGEFVKKLLSNCHVLENLVAEQCQADNVTIFTVIVPSLKSLVLETLENRHGDDTHGFVVDCPSLEKFDIFHSNGFCVIENNMTKIVDANLVVKSWNFWKKLGSITSVKRLYLCVPSSKDVYPSGSVFCFLVHFKICTCETEWLNLLMRVLRDSPNLQALKIEQCHILRSNEPRPCWNTSWNEPKSVPECVSSSLKTFEWVKYEGAEEEKEAVAFVFRNAKYLKKATINISSTCTELDKKLEVIKELFSSSKRSPACQLEFRSSYE